MKLDIKKITTDFLVIGGGTAGCWAAIKFCEKSDKNVLIVEKANIKRSGCLAAGVNALNAYIGEGKTPQDYVDYARRDASGIVRGDLLLTMSERLRKVTAELEKLGLTILKNEDGKYVERGWRNVKINGENIKPLLANAVNQNEQITVLNRVNVFKYIVQDNRIIGGYGISIEKPILYLIFAKAVLISTGGAAGLYKPNHAGFSRHKMWYPPFNTGAGLSMGINAGAEMTTFEMRFIALRCKDTIAPTGTLAQGVGAKQVNSLGEVYEDKYGLTTSERVYGTVCENVNKRGPCYLKTKGISKQADEDLIKAYLNMAPSQTLRWIESKKPPSEENVEIEGTEPYIVGGHTASGYHVNTSRETTIKGLFAAGDVAGGCPQKYVTGALAEAEIAVESADKYMNENILFDDLGQVKKIKHELERFFIKGESAFTTDDLEEHMQEIMDKYAGGISANYKYNQKSLELAKKGIGEIKEKCKTLKVKNMQELVYVLELKERLVICDVLISHLLARKETRWHCFAEHGDYPDKNDEYRCYINSRLYGGKIKIFKRFLIEEGEVYEHHEYRN